MKKFLFLVLGLANLSYADYLDHPESKQIINELVEAHGFDRQYVETVLKDAKKQQKIIDSISKPAELHGHGKDIKNCLLKKKELEMEKNLLKII